MAEFKPIVITNLGQSLMSKMIEGTTGVRFTKIDVSSKEYDDSEVESLTSLDDVEQSSGISKITRENEVAVKLEAAIDNRELTQGYFMNTVGIYAKDPDEGEVLYGVMSASTPGWMPPYNGTSSSSAVFNLTITVGNAENVTVVLSGSATATKNDIDELQAQIDDIMSFVGYTDDDIYGVEVDLANRKFTRIAGAQYLVAPEGFDNLEPWNRKRCILADDGAVLAYYGDAGYTEGGELLEAIEKNGVAYPKGTHVQVMVEQPKFYYRVVPLELEKEEDDGYGYSMRKARYYISATAKSGFKCHPLFCSDGENEVEYAYLAAYDGCLYDVSAGTYILDDAQVVDTSADMLSSISGAKPASGYSQNISRTTLRTISQNRGSDWGLQSAAAASATQMLFLVEYASFNMQDIIGDGNTMRKDDDGTTNMSDATGTTAGLGSRTGAIYNSEGRQHISYRGEENFYGNMWDWIDGINEFIDVTSTPQINDIYVATQNYDDSTATGYHKLGYRAAIEAGYVSAFGYDEECDWMFMTTETEGDSSLPVGDWHYPHETSASEWKGMRLGGRWGSGLRAGGFCWTLSSAASTRFRSDGGRLLYVPSAIGY